MITPYAPQGAGGCPGKPGISVTSMGRCPSQTATPQGEKFPLDPLMFGLGSDA